MASPRRSNSPRSAMRTTPRTPRRSPVGILPEVCANGPQDRTEYAQRYRRPSMIFDGIPACRPAGLPSQDKRLPGSSSENAAEALDDAVRTPGNRHDATPPRSQQPARRTNQPRNGNAEPSWDPPTPRARATSPRHFVAWPQGEAEYEAERQTVQGRQQAQTEAAHWLSRQWELWAQGMSSIMGSADAAAPPPPRAPPSVLSPEIVKLNEAMAFVVATLLRGLDTSRVEQQRLHKTAQWLDKELVQSQEDVARLQDALDEVLRARSEQLASEEDDNTQETDNNIDPSEVEKLKDDNATLTKRVKDCEDEAEDLKRKLRRLEDDSRHLSPTVQPMMQPMQPMMQPMQPMMQPMVMPIAPQVAPPQAPTSSISEARYREIEVDLKQAVERRQELELSLQKKQFDFDAKELEMETVRKKAWDKQQEFEAKEREMEAVLKQALVSRPELESALKDALEQQQELEVALEESRGTFEIVSNELQELKHRLWRTRKMKDVVFDVPASIMGLFESDKASSDELSFWKPILKNSEFEFDTIVERQRRNKITVESRIGAMRRSTSNANESEELFGGAITQLQREISGLRCVIASAPDRAGVLAGDRDKRSWRPSLDRDGSSSVSIEGFLNVRELVNAETSSWFESLVNECSQFAEVVQIAPPWSREVRTRERPLQEVPARKVEPT
eukprot:TRINITY_DN7065_c0_g1_i1.p1 TRINITY_DN7065_c0_g1~~TRINITY_DN7065_c0_g1_i1.p1  ORF type:complete len:690 (-),score=142.10 TRINITY_DN7065_c0_g1_i1:132-2156(-)